MGTAEMAYKVRELPLRETLRTRKKHSQQATDQYIATAESKLSHGQTTTDVRSFIVKLLKEAKSQGKSHIDLVSGDIHRQMGLKNRMPMVCRAMYQELLPSDRVLHTTPSGQSSTIRIRYYLKSREP